MMPPASWFPLGSRCVDATLPAHDTFPDAPEPNVSVDASAEPYAAPGDPSGRPFPEPPSPAVAWPAPELIGVLLMNETPLAAPMPPGPPRRFAVPADAGPSIDSPVSVVTLLLHELVSMLH